MLLRILAASFFFGCLLSLRAFDGQQFYIYPQAEYLRKQIVSVWDGGWIVGRLRRGMLHAGKAW